MKRPSQNDNYANEAERFLAADIDVEPLIRGIEDKDRILMWWNTANRLGIEGQEKEQIKTRMAYLHRRQE